MLNAKLRRANDLKTVYPNAHQWYFAYQTCKQLYEHSVRESESSTNAGPELVEAPPSQIASLELTPNEQLQVLCAIVREQIDIGNYEAAYKILQPWWSFGNSPRIDGLDALCCADLLLTAGEVATFIASLFDLSNSTLVNVLEDLKEEDRDLRSLALMRLGGLERNAGRVKDALARLVQATHLAESCWPWVKGRCYLELASTHKDLTT